MQAVNTCQPVSRTPVFLCPKFQHSVTFVKKTKKRKRAMRKDGVVSDANLHFVKRLLALK